MPACGWTACWVGKMTDDPRRESLLEFPCEFPVKAMGRADQPVRAVFERIVAEHVPQGHVLSWDEKPSGKGNFIAVTVCIQASDQDQLDRIYHALTDAPEILVAL